MAKTTEIIAIGCDHAGYEMKEYIKTAIGERGFEVKDFGAYSAESVDYPDPIHPLAASIEKGLFKRGIIICRSGNGAAMVANKYAHVRAALCWQPEIAKLARLHNDANIISLPARFITNNQAVDMVGVFLYTDFEGGRHQQRVNKIVDNIQM